LAENNYREYHPVDLDNKQVDDLLVTCSDHRFQRAFEAVAQNRDLERADKIVFPAPAQNIANGVLIPAIEKLQGLHAFSTISVYDHLYCGGTDYEGASAEEEMILIHQRKQVAAINAIHEVMPEMTVITYVVGVEEIVSATDSRILSYV